MKILMLSWEYPPQSVGGLAQHVYHLSRAVAKHGVEVHVVTIGGKDALPYEEQDGVKIHRVFPYQLESPDFRTWILHLNFSLLEYAVTLVNSLKGVDVIHAHDWLVAYAGRALKHAFNTPLIATIHATEYGRNHGLHNDNQRYISNVEWWLTYESWKVIVCSYYMERELKGFFGIPDDKLAVIPNGVDPDAFVIKKGAKALKNQEEKYVFFIGRLVREKGVHILIEAAPKILSVFPQARFIIAGTGPYEQELKNLARAKQLEHRIHFAGYVNDDDRNQLYNQSSVAVFPSLYEPFGIVALEAMAAKVPVVVSDTGGLSEIVEHGIDGLKCYCDSPNSLADNIMAILGNDELAQRIKRKGYEKAVHQFNWFHIATKTIQCYENVMEQSRRSDWHTDTWSASDPISALYGRIKKIGATNLFSQRA